MPAAGRRTLAGLMLAIAAIAAALGVLRGPLGEVLALILAGAIGCGLAPRKALDGMRRIEAEVDRDRAASGRPALEGRDLARLRARAFLLTLAAWTLVAVAVGAGGVALARLLRPD